MQSTGFLIAVFEFVLLLFSLSFHECAHAWMASRLGDQTARMQGRITLNPLYHADLWGTFLIPAIIIFGPFFGFSLFSGALIGWAKPTPVITRNFRKIRRDDNLTTLAGPISNLILVLVAYAVLAIMAVVLPDGHRVVGAAFVETVRSAFLMSAGANIQVLPQPVALFCSLAILVNLSLLFFNLLPIPPLDGSHVLRNILPYNAVQAYDRIPIWISYLLMFFVGGYVLMELLRPSLAVVYFGIMHV